MNLNATLLGQMFTFMIFVWFTMKFVWPVIMQAIADREAKIADGLAAAARGQQSLQAAQQQVELQLREIKEKANHIVEQAQKRADLLIDDAKQKAHEEAAHILASARQEISREVLQSREALRLQVAELAVLGAERILRQQIDVSANQRLLAELVEEI